MVTQRWARPLKSRDTDTFNISFLDLTINGIMSAKELESKHDIHTSTFGPLQRLNFIG